MELALIGLCALQIVAMVVMVTVLSRKPGQTAKSATEHLSVGATTSKPPAFFHGLSGTHVPNKETTKAP